MRGLLQACIIGNLLACFFEGSPAQAQEQVEIAVSVFRRADVKETTLIDAESGVASIYRQAGINIRWKNFSGHKITEFTDQKLTNRTELLLNITHASGALSDDAYGVAFLDNRGDGSLCDIFYDRILSLYGNSSAGLARLLGMVMAHELGHLLLGLNAHSSDGVMKAQWNARSFLPGQFVPTFTRQQVRSIHQRLQSHR